MAAPTTIEIFSSFIENLALVTDQLRNGVVDRVADGFDLDNFWQRINVAVKCLSKECTKLVLVFSEPPVPTPTDCQTMISTIEKTTLALISIYYTLPKIHGECLLKSVTDSVLLIIEGVSSLAECIKTQGFSGTQDCTLMSTGCLWEACEKFESLPKTNREVVLKQVKEHLELIKDAINELEEAMNSEDGAAVEDDGGGGEDDLVIWSESDRSFVTSCIGLMKCTRGLLKKLTTVLRTIDCDSMLVIHDLDDLNERLKCLSPVTDDLAMSLYPPINHTVALIQMNENAEMLNNTIEFVKQGHLSSESDAAWIELLLNAVQHNLQKAKTLNGQ
ncbi:cyclin-D1-binding protein 1 homolog [Tubulanus polymorphus]|uniref:cyclin-D1-binding protein 1 homolog n=1 Tax=Tubulanus polymorphus TaxID=672921 RepID=UPI003DA36836